MAKIKSLASSPGTRQWQRWKENSQFSRSLFHARKRSAPCSWARKLSSAPRWRPAASPALSHSPSAPPKQPRLLLALKPRREMLLLDLRS